MPRASFKRTLIIETVRPESDPQLEIPANIIRRLNWLVGLTAATCMTFGFLLGWFANSAKSAQNDSDIQQSRTIETIAIPIADVDELDFAQTKDEKAIDPPDPNESQAETMPAVAQRALPPKCDSCEKCGAD